MFGCCRFLQLDRLGCDQPLELVGTNRMGLVAGSVLGDQLAPPLAVQPFLQCQAEQLGSRLASGPCRTVQVAEQGLVYGYGYGLHIAMTIVGGRTPADKRAGGGAPSMSRLYGASGRACAVDTLYGASGRGVHLRAPEYFAPGGVTGAAGQSLTRTNF